MWHSIRKFLHHHEAYHNVSCAEVCKANESKAANLARRSHQRLTEAYAESQSIASFFRVAASFVLLEVHLLYPPDDLEARMRASHGTSRCWIFAKALLFTLFQELIAGKHAWTNFAAHELAAPCCRVGWVWPAEVLAACPVIGYPSEDMNLTWLVASHDEVVAGAKAGQPGCGVSTVRETSQGVALSCHAFRAALAEVGCPDHPSFSASFP